MKKQKPCPDTMPRWWNPNGAKMEVKHADGRVVMLANNAASVAIRPVRDTHDQPAYRIEWNLRQLGRDKFLGYLTFPEGYLTAAFAVAAWGRFSAIGRYKATDAHPGYFIRTGSHLNIPGPGTGRDGDPNVSILLTDPVRAAIGQFLTRSIAAEPIARPARPDLSLGTASA